MDIKKARYKDKFMAADDVFAHSSTSRPSLIKHEAASNEKNSIGTIPALPRTRIVWHKNSDSTLPENFDMIVRSLSPCLYARYQKTLDTKYAIPLEYSDWRSSAMDTATGGITKMVAK
mmetsp:Transcript_7759/g.14035  ORF Transcript_7759/g.14035 Transcript_7759/m.14035 type:complete len:118 (-) Transcript_7759:757-1110(-)